MHTFGQHFLTDRAALRKIAAAAETRPTDTIIEIGPGHGELTRELRAAAPAARIIVIERDVQLVEGLRNTFPGDTVEVYPGDALAILPDLVKECAGGAYTMVGNIPYYITGHLLRVVGELSPRPVACVFTVQKEVAQRLIAAPPQMNRLASSVQFWAKSRILFPIARQSFHPVPRVDSAAVYLETRPAEEIDNQEVYYYLVRSLFQQPRKTILNNLISATRRGRQEMEALIVSHGLIPAARPQDLTRENIISLAADSELTNSLQQ